MAEKIRVRVSVTVEVDPDMWAELNGLMKRSEVREDVKGYVWTHLQGMSMIEDTEGQLEWNK